MKFINYLLIFILISFGNCSNSQSEKEDTVALLRLLTYPRFTGVNLKLGNGLNSITKAMSSISGSRFATLSRNEELGNNLFGTRNTSVQSTRNPLCSSKGEPWGVNALMTPDNPEFPSRSVYCKTFFNPLSPESPRGALFLAGGIECMAERAGLFEGLQAGASKTVEIPFAEGIRNRPECWGTTLEFNEWLQEINTLPFSSMRITATVLPNTDAYQTQIQITAISNSGTLDLIRLKMRIENGKIIALSEELEPGKNLAYRVSFDTVSGRLYFEFTKQDASEVDRIRVHVRGDVEPETVRFSQVERMSGFNLIAPTTGAISSFNIIKGRESQGIRSQTYGTNIGLRPEVCIGSSVCSGVNLPSVSGAVLTPLVTGAATAIDNLKSRTNDWTYEWVSLENIE